MPSKMPKYFEKKGSKIFLKLGVVETINMMHIVSNEYFCISSKLIWWFWRNLRTELIILFRKGERENTGVGEREGVGDLEFLADDLILFWFFSSISQEDKKF